MKASFKAKYDADKATADSAVTLAFNAGDVKLCASMTDATVVNGPCLNGLALAVQKPGSFSIDYNVPKKDFRFMFMNTIKISDKPLNMVYSHSRGDQRTMLDGTLVIDSANKVSANHVLGSGNCKLKYTYVHGGVTTFEPSYDLAKDSWDFAVSRKVYADHVLKAVYQTSNQNLALDWSTKSKMMGSYKVSHHGPYFTDCLPCLIERRSSIYLKFLIGLLTTSVQDRSKGFCPNIHVGILGKK